MNEILKLDGERLTVDDVAAVARRGARVDLSDAARQLVAGSREWLMQLMADGRPIYGLTTGFGALDGCTIPPELNHAQQHCLLKSHAAGMGSPMNDEAVRAMMVIRANVLASGLCGVAPEVLDCLIAMLNAGMTPYVPVRGSVGACGDLAPLAHMALPMIGLGKARIGEGGWLDGPQAMAQAGIEAPELSGRDGIGLINGTEQTTGIGALAVHDAEQLCRRAEEVSALALEALGAVSDSFDERTALWKGHPGQILTSARLRELTEGSQAVRPPRPDRLRDSLSLRCIPQVIGATRGTVSRARQVIEIEMNAANDNPLFGVADSFVTSNSGNFHGQAAGEALDQIATAVISLAVISERRCARLVDEKLSGLPAFLIHPDSIQGRDHGFMIAQYTAAAIVAEMRMQSVPASIQSIPTCANTEDHVPMSPLAARRAAEMVARAGDVLAAEALLSAQALDLKKQKPAPALDPLYQAIRAQVPMMVEDRVIGPDLEAVRGALFAW
jgi:histidine ammonia-lyase